MFSVILFIVYILFQNEKKSYSDRVLVQFRTMTIWDVLFFV